MPVLSSTINYNSLSLTSKIPLNTVKPVAFSGGELPYYYRISPNLPTGLSFDELSGAISGVPLTATETATYTVSIIDTAHDDASGSFSLSVNTMTAQLSFVEGVPVSAPLVPFTVDNQFQIIAGSLPSGLTLSTSTGAISGTPDYVINDTESRFVVRTSNTSGYFIDKTITATVVGADPVVWSTSAGFLPGDYTTSTAYLPIGPNGESFAINNQYVSYQFVATPAQSPTNTKVRYYLPEGSGVIPPGLTLSESGVLSGFIRDTLTFDGSQVDTGGYDEEEYDKFAYDHGLVAYDSIGVPKIYQFKVTATDGVMRSTRYFKILVVSPDMIRYPDRIQMTLEPGLLTPNPLYLPPLQFINGVTSVEIRADNNQILDLSAYDPYPTLGVVAYTVIPGGSELTNLPNNLSLDSNTGLVHGYVPFQPAYTRNYTVTIAATRSYSTQTVTSTNTLLLGVKGNIEQSIRWISSSTLGTLVTGEISNLSVVAERIDSDIKIKYIKSSGTLPNGVMLAIDGSLVGKPTYGSTGTFTFTVTAQDIYELSSIDKTFTLSVKDYSNTEFTNIYVKPYLPLDKREIYKRFISDDSIFVPNSIYRTYDMNFGVQSEIKLVLSYGVQQLNIADYVSALQENFYRKHLYFGEVKVAIATDDNNLPLYEVVYIDIVDNLVNSTNQSVSPVIHSNNEMYYPSSVPNMKSRLEHIVMPNYTYIRVNSYGMPKFMRTPQLNDYRPPGYMSVMPLCYVLPGEGKKILSRIQNSGFDFKQFNFEIDRIIVEQDLAGSTDKYLIFERRTISDKLDSDNYLFGIDGVRIEINNGTPLEKE
jgi:hypothetical protein